MNQNDSVLVKNFTEGYTGITCPTTPREMDLSQVKFLSRMILSELDEFLCTVTKNAEERDALMQEVVESRDRCKVFDYPTTTSRIAAQADSLVDSWYYSLDTAGKHGMNLSRIFTVVHQSNMAKADPVTGKFIRRESDGKVIKPANWSPPDVEAEIDRQTREGTWN